MWPDKGRLLCGKGAGICSLEVKVTIMSCSEWLFVNNKWPHWFSWGWGWGLAVGWRLLTFRFLFWSRPRHLASNSMVCQGLSWDLLVMAWRLPFRFQRSGFLRCPWWVEGGRWGPVMRVSWEGGPCCCSGAEFSRRKRAGLEVLRRCHCPPPPSPALVCWEAGPFGSRSGWKTEWAVAWLLIGAVDLTDKGAGRHRTFCDFLHCSSLLTHAGS